MVEAWVIYLSRTKHAGIPVGVIVAASRDDAQGLARDVMDARGLDGGDLRAVPVRACSSEDVGEAILADHFASSRDAPRE